MTSVPLAIRSTFLWTLGVLHFVPVCTLLVILGAFVDPRHFDPLLRLFVRNQVRLTGARLVVHRAKRFDPERTCVFLGNHVNVFDPFVAYSAIPQFFRGLELESHFRVPVYGWLMNRFGNVPVPDRRSSAGLRLMKRRFRESLAAGTSILGFPEGTRTRTGRVGRFHLGVIRMARESGVPIVPVTLAGSFRLKRVGSRVLRPATIVVHLHDPIEPEEARALGLKELRDRVRAVIRGPLADG